MCQARGPLGPPPRTRQPAARPTATTPCRRPGNGSQRPITAPQPAQLLQSAQRGPDPRPRTWECRSCAGAEEGPARCGPPSRSRGALPRTDGQPPPTEPPSGAQLLQSARYGCSATLRAPVLQELCMSRGPLGPPRPDAAAGRPTDSSQPPTGSSHPVPPSRQRVAEADHRAAASTTPAIRPAGAGSTAPEAGNAGVLPPPGDCRDRGPPRRPITPAPAAGSRPHG